MLNNQDWLRFWVEEHLVLPAAGSASGSSGHTSSGRAHLKSRRTISFDNARLSSSTSLLAGVRGTAEAAVADSAAAGAAADATPGGVGTSSMAQVQVIRWVAMHALRGCCQPEGVCKASC
jgi:hypothetical protein